MAYEKVTLNNIANECLLCHNAKCDKACPKGYKPSDFLRSVRFGNETTKAVDKSICASCDAPCEKACVNFDRPIRIKKAIELAKENIVDTSDISLDIEFLGVKCENPFFLSSSVVGSDYEMCAKALEMGWGGIVFKTIGFYIPDEVSPRFSAIKKDGTPFVGFKNMEQISDHPLKENLEILATLKKNYPSKIIVASIMGQSEEEWTELARLCDEAGVDIIECNFSCPQMAVKGMGSDVGTNVELVSKYTAATVKGTTKPVLAKMTPNITNMEIPAIAAMKAGAAGLAAINTIKCITNVDLYNMQSDPNIDGKCAVSGYSGKAVKPIALRFISDMAKCPEIKSAPISGMGGIETWQDALEFIALGCTNIQITTAIMQYGYRIIDDLIDGAKTYLKTQGYKKLDEIVGMGLTNIISADQLNRSTVVFPMFDKEKCVGCGRCYVSCYDGGHQAITLDQDNMPKLNGSKCVGCHLCRLVCPTDAIGIAKRINKPKRC